MTNQEMWSRIPTNAHELVHELFILDYKMNKHTRTHKNKFMIKFMAITW